MAQIKDLIVNGVGRFIGKLYASEFIGKLTGNADTATSATKAVQDESGNNIKSSYASSISISNHTITLKNKNGASLGTVTVPDNNTVYTHPTTSGNKHIPSGGSSGQILRWSADGTAVWGADNNTTYRVATSSTLGLVKSGTDITVDSSGNVSVNDDSHNHVISNVDGLQSALNGKAASSHTHSTATWSGKTDDRNYYVAFSLESQFNYDSSNSFLYNPSTKTLKAGIFSGSLSGNASTATKLQTARTFTIGNTSRSFDGSGNVSWTLAEIGAAASSHTHSYAGSSSAGGSATSAVKLDSSAGSATQPVYFSGGKPVACTYTLGKSVPSNAVFTDTNTWNAMIGATSSANGSVGYVNAVPPKDGYNTKFLRADGTWSVPSYPSVGNGTITITQNGTTKGTFTMNQSGNTTIALTDTDKDTHYTAKLVTGNSKTNTNNNGSLTNGNVFLNLIENNTVRSSHKITGSGATAVTTDTDGNIVINTPQSNISALNIVSGNEIRFNLNGGMSGTDELYINYKFADGTQASKIKTYKFLTGNGDEVANVKAYLDWSYIKNCPVKSGKSVDNTIKSTFRTQLKGDANSGTFITAFRNASDSSLTDFPIYSSGLSWGVSNTNSYLMTRYSTPEAWIGAGSDNKITWTRQLAFVNDLAKYLPLSGGTMTGSLIFHQSNPRSQISWNSSDSRLEIATGPNSYILIKDGYTGVTSNVEAALTSSNGAIRVENNVISISCASSISITGGGPLYINKEWTKTSDKNLKNNITSLDDRFDILFDNLKPVKYNLILDNSNKEYYGFIAQDIEDCLSDANIDINTSGIIDIQELNKREQRKNNDGELEDVENSVTNYLLDKGITKKYGLNYDGFISLLVDQVQKLKSRIEELENKLNERGI